MLSISFERDETSFRLLRFLSFAFRQCVPSTVEKNILVARPPSIPSCPSPKAILDGDLLHFLSSQETGQNQMALHESYEHA